MDIRHCREDDKPLWDLMNNDHVFISCFNSNKNEFNDKYVSQHENVYVLTPNVHGRHCTPLADKLIGHAKAIPLNLALSPGMLVKLKVNICPEHGLCNNARGRVVIILYPPTENDRAEGYEFGSYKKTGASDSVVIVDFEKYSGPVISPHLQRTWVPIVAINLCCGHERRCCYRNGLPLNIAKADNGHGFQGAQIGSTKKMKRATICFGNNGAQRAEAD